MTSADSNSVELRSMSESLPIRRLTAQIKRQATDAVIGEIIGEQDRDLGILVQFACPKSCADACIAPAHDQQSHRHPASDVEIVARSIRYMCENLIDLWKRYRLPYFIDFSLQRERIKGCERQGDEQADPPIQGGKGVPESPFDLLRRSFDCGGVRYAPVSRHRLARPKWAYFLSGVVADGKDKVKRR